MGYSNEAIQGYTAIDPALTSPGRAESLVFAKVTRRMETVFADDASSHATRAGALHDNRRLWQAAAMSCASEDNAMTDDLRASLIGLAGFVDRHTSEVLGNSASPDILFEINRRVAAGLTNGAI